MKKIKVAIISALFIFSFLLPNTTQAMSDKWKNVIGGAILGGTSNYLRETNGSSGSYYGGYWGWGTPTNEYGLPNNTITGVINMVVNWLLSLLGILGIAGFVVAGIMYIVAAGDKDSIDRAKKVMTFSIIGVVVGLLGLVVVNTIDSVLRY